jgi:HSP20 family protein
MLTRWRNWGLFDFDRDHERTLADFDLLRREMNRLFEGYPSTGRPRSSSSASWPRIALFDKGAHLLVRAEVPGMSEKDVQVTVDQGVLTLRGDRTVQPPEGYSAHRQERSNYRFARSFSLPCKVDLEKTKAELKNGVLTLTLPKAPEEQPRQIAVNVQ